ncbi:MAG: VWA domain-containing protein [Clostridiaceae bacterium]|nr:VWA domain-containing protein [Clostridiaceae bacterium]
MKMTGMVRILAAALCFTAVTGGTMFARPVDNRPLIQIALLLDTSNSMDGLINQAKSQLWKIVSESGRMTRGGERARLEVALYEYGNDANSVISGYVRQVVPFTNDLDRLSACLFELDTYGGSEYCGAVIKKSLNELDWSGRESDLRIVYIAGNEPFTQGLVDYRSAGKKASRMGVVVNTIHCGDREEGFRTGWADGARITGGEYLTIEGDFQYQYVPCPQDDRLSELNSRLNDTYLAFGDEGEKRKEMQSEQDSMAEELNKSGFYERAKVKSSASYSNSGWDLVDATSSGAVVLSEVQDDDLPAAVRALPLAARQAFVEGKLTERKKIQAEIAALSAERESYLAENAAAAPADEALDTAILAPLSALAKDKGFVVEE